MIDQVRFKKILIRYMSDFHRRWNEDQEYYKWEAVQHFQKAWDIEAPDFTAMLSDAFSKTSNLLANANNFPLGMLLEFSNAAPEELRTMFRNLFDEEQDVYMRITAFKQLAAEMRALYSKDAPQHFQTENAITTYLWLRYPDKYYIYKLSEARNVAAELKSNITFKKGAYSENLHTFFDLYGEINKELRLNTKVKKLLQDHLTESCYPDPLLHTLTVDFGFYISRFIAEGDDVELESTDWWPSVHDYTPGFTKEKWLELLNNPNIIGPIWGSTLASFYAAGGEATCTQIAEETNDSPYSISGRCTNLAKRIYKETKCKLLEQDGKKRYWPILFQGKNAGSDIPGSFIWTLRPELYDALTDFDIVGKYGKQTVDPPVVNPDELQSKAEFRRWFRPFLDALVELGGSAPRLKVHEKIISMCGIPEEELSKKSSAGTAIIANQFDWSRNYLNYEGFMDSSAPNGIWALNELGRKILMTEDLAGKIIAKWVKIKTAQREGQPVPVIDLTPYYTYRPMIEKYSKKDFLNEVYLKESQYTRLVATLKKKKNIILQGAPGVGKTFAARRLAWSMMGEKDDSRIAFVQFHQNYSYEDFVMGYKPTDNGFALKSGIFYDFCKTAASQPNLDFFFIIDEINRGNMSKIFGELLMLIENNYRDTAAKLAYTGEAFSVPGNLYIIGMMNTADRSLAMIDYALRRRFSFFEMEPGFESDGFSAYQKSLNNDTLNELIKRVQDLNKTIANDKTLGKGFRIGHSYFCGCTDCTDEWLHDIVDFDIIPMLSEYWFDEPTTLADWVNILQGVFHDQAQ